MTGMTDEQILALANSKEFCAISKSSSLIRAAARKISGGSETKKHRATLRNRVEQFQKLLEEMNDEHN